MKNTSKTKTFLSCKKGLATLEFAILFLPFFLLVMSLLETMILVYQISIIDYITTSAGQYASASSPSYGYQKRFQEYIDKHKNNLLLFTDTKNSLKPSLEFCRSIAEMANANCTGNDIENKLIIYTLNYKISPIFKILRIFQMPENTSSRVVYYSEGSEYKEDEENPTKKGDDENKK